MKRGWFGLGLLVVLLIGGLLAISSGETLITLGGLVSFLALSRSFNMPIGHISNQINSIVMALAGAERIFELMDEAPEEDHGYVTLVNAKIDENGNVVRGNLRKDIIAVRTDIVASLENVETFINERLAAEV